MWGTNRGAELQPKFRSFHESIMLTDRTHQSVLREKRDRVLNRLRDYLKQQGLRFEFFNQGSYAMSTGVIPLDGDFDIDVGIVFSGSARPQNPLEPKRWVFDGVQGHTRQVEWKTPCITVQYIQQGEPKYHVDLPVLWDDGRRLWLARGKRNSAPPHACWEEDDRRGFVKLVQEHRSGEQRDQFRRVVRALKRWRDFKFPTEGHAAPVGVGLTVLALRGFSPVANDDLSALRNFVNWTRQQFGWSWSGRLSAQMPVAPHDDVFKRMTDKQMTEFKQRLDQLAGWLDEAAHTGSTIPLRKAFGDAFPA